LRNSVFGSVMLGGRPMPNAIQLPPPSATIASQYTPPVSEAANRVGPTVAYLNSLLRDVFDAGYVIVLSERHECPGEGCARALPQVSIDLFEPGEPVHSRSPLSSSSEPAYVLVERDRVAELERKAASYDRINTPELSRTTS
jgi:hypothetical protein